MIENEKSEVQAGSRKGNLQNQDGSQMSRLILPYTKVKIYIIYSLIV